MEKTIYKTSLGVEYLTFSDGNMIVYEGNCYELNEIGNEIFKSILKKKPVDNIFVDLKENYDIDEKQLENDINSFIDNLLSLNIIKKC